METKIHSPQQLHRRPLLVTGASGALGHWICRVAISHWTVYGIHWRHLLKISQVTAVRTDLTCLSKLKKLFSTINPEAVIHAAAVAQPAVCEANPYATHIINVGVPRILATLCADNGIPFLFTSTDLVFNGKKAPYDEQCMVSPITVYGQQKAQAEAAVLEAYPDALVCRMPLMFGIGPRKSGNFFMQMLSAIHENRSIGLFIDEFRTPVDFLSAAKGLLRVLGRSQGILHLGGKTRISRFELGMLIAQQMETVPSMLDPISTDAFCSEIARSPDCTLNSNAAFALGYDPMPLADAINRIVDQYTYL